MKTWINRPVLFVSLVISGFGLTACQSDKHTMVKPQEGTVIACGQCYDQVYKVTHLINPRGMITSTDTHTRHMCPSCKTEMSVYTEHGVTMVKCAKCAPEGLACDKCLPPKGYVPPADASAAK